MAPRSRTQTAPPGASPALRIAALAAAAALVLPAVAGCTTIELPMVPRTKIAAQTPKIVPAADKQKRDKLMKDAIVVARQAAVEVSHRGFYAVTPRNTRMTQMPNGVWYAAIDVHMPGMGDLVFVLTNSGGGWSVVGKGTGFKADKPQFGVPGAAWSSIAG